MIVLLQRVKSAEVLIEQKSYQTINQGLLVFLGIRKNDSEADIDFLIDKILNLRIFNDNNNKMNLSIMDCNEEIMVVSQFTLTANTKKGRRPSFIESELPDVAIELYKMFITKLKQQKIRIKTGKFGANMDVKLTNSGPATFILDSKN